MTGHWFKVGDRVRVYEGGDGRKPTVPAVVEKVGRVMIRVRDDEGNELVVHSFEVFAPEESD